MWSTWTSMIPWLNSILTSVPPPPPHLPLELFAAAYIFVKWLGQSVLNFATSSCNNWEMLGFSDVEVCMLGVQGWMLAYHCKILVITEYMSMSVKLCTSPCVCVCFVCVCVCKKKMGRRCQWGNVTQCNLTSKKNELGWHHSIHKSTHTHRHKKRRRFGVLLFYLSHGKQVFYP